MELHLTDREIFVCLFALLLTGFANSSSLYDIESIKKELNCTKNREIIEVKQNEIIATCVGAPFYRTIKIEGENKSVGDLLDGKPFKFEYIYKYSSSKNAWEPYKVIDHSTGEEWDGSHIAIPVELPEIHPALKSNTIETSSHPMLCGNAIELNYHAEVDGLLSYYDNKTGELLMHCGGVCMSGVGSGKDCSQCPPKEWICKQ